MLLEQKKADNMEVITSMYKRRQLSKRFQYQTYSDILLTFLACPLAFSLIDFTVSTLVGIALFLAILTFSKKVLMRTLRHHVNRVRIEYKEDKQSIMNGQTIKERRIGPEVSDHPLNSEESKNQINKSEVYEQRVMTKGVAQM